MEGFLQKRTKVTKDGNHRGTEGEHKSLNHEWTRMDTNAARGTVEQEETEGTETG